MAARPWPLRRNRRRNLQPDLKDTINGPNVRSATVRLRFYELSRFDQEKFGKEHVTCMTIILVGGALIEEE